MTEKAYQWNASDYARHSNAQFQWAQELIDKLHLVGSEKVLDIGCGDGKVTALIGQNVPHGSVTGVDRSWSMVALARQQFGLAGSNLAFAQMDAAQLCFEDGFDAAFSNAALHWVKDHWTVLQGVARSLRPGGHLLFQMGGRGNALEIITAMDAVRAQAAWKNYFATFDFPYGFYGPEEYHLWLREAGLKEQRAELIPKDMQHPGREGLTGWLRTTWLPYTDPIPVEQREAFIDAVADAYLRSHPMDEQGTAHVKMVRLEVEAVKW